VNGLAPPEPLLAACCAGDRQAFAQLFELCRDRVYAIAVHLCADRGVAADVTQDVFIKLLTRMPQFRRQAAFSTWLYRIVVNTAIDYQRATRRIVPLPTSNPRVRPEGDSVETNYARAERNTRIRAAVLGLPMKLRAPLVLRHIEGLAYHEIAETLAISPGTVASRLSRAHRRLARELADLR
jgi:RNA polymerase sigma-70 factor (ECF subfamily)